MKITIYTSQIEEALKLYLSEKHGFNSEIDDISFVEIYCNGEHETYYETHKVDEIHVYIKEKE